MSDPTHDQVQQLVAEGSVTQLLAAAKGRQEAATTDLWNRYFQRLVVVARGKLQGGPTRAADAEDAALSAFGSLISGLQMDRFRELDDRDDLWQVLVMLTVRKAINQRKHEAAQKRGGGNVRGESVFGGQDDRGDLAAGIAQLVDQEPTPEDVVQLQDELDHLFQLLDEELQQVARWRLAGYTNQEIAEMSGHVISWVERKFRIIRNRWAKSIQ